MFIQYSSQPPLFDLHSSTSERNIQLNLNEEIYRNRNIREKKTEPCLQAHKKGLSHYFSPRGKGWGILRGYMISGVRTDGGSIVADSV